MSTLNSGGLAKKVPNLAPTRSSEPLFSSAPPSMTHTSALPKDFCRMLALDATTVLTHKLLFGNLFRF
jgi:hypothetical protein